MDLTKYRIGNKIIDLKKLVAVGDLYSKYAGCLVLPLAFNFNSNVVAEFRDGEDGLPKYTGSTKGDYTEFDSDFYREVQQRVSEMVESWEKVA